MHIKYIDPQTYALFVAFKRLQIYTSDNISEATFFNSVKKCSLTDIVRGI